MPSLRKSWKRFNKLTIKTIKLTEEKENFMFDLRSTRLTSEEKDVVSEEKEIAKFEVTLMSMKDT